MKSIIRNKSTESSYPCLKQSNTSGLLVLFTEKDCGTVLHVGNSNYLIGDYDHIWDEEKFSLFTSEVVLSN